MPHIHIILAIKGVLHNLKNAWFSVCVTCSLSESTYWSSFSTQEREIYFNQVLNAKEIRCQLSAGQPTMVCNSNPYIWADIDSSSLYWWICFDLCVQNSFKLRLSYILFCTFWFHNFARSDLNPSGTPSNTLSAIGIVHSHTLPKQKSRLLPNLLTNILCQRPKLHLTEDSMHLTGAYEAECLTPDTKRKVCLWL